MVRKRKRTKKATTPYLIFISHSSADLWIAEQIGKQIGELGAEVWLDKKDLKGGDVLVDEILRGIDACDEAVVAVSPKSIKSQWVVYEIGAVSGQHKRVTPILNHVNAEALTPVKGVKSIDLNQFGEFLIQLRKRISGRKNSKRS